MNSSVWPYGKRPKYEPKLFKPKSKNPKGMLAEFLSEGRRIIQDYDQCLTRHKSLIEAEASSLPTADDDQWFEAIEALLKFGEPAEFSYDFHELRRAVLNAKDAQNDLDLFDTFLRIGKVCGGAPLWSAIWDANQWIDCMYEPPSSAREEPQFQVWAFVAAIPAVNALKLYVEVAKRFGEENLMAILDGVPMIVDKGPQKE